ncbi:type II toxin-antitoxin system RelE family toxin [Pararhizobium sp. PWRC1-1]|uniref:type II toxin-antitoxin system RelE family toxin n=1 Tax=Pararhizobium sp. PWRC1-1 TaxID=2804566 RepID=UPI003CE73930
MRIIYDKQAIKVLTRMPATDARRIWQKVQQYAENPASLANNVKKLQGVDYYRLRVGDWRVIFTEDGLVIDVIKIAGRGDVYQGLEP